MLVVEIAAWRVRHSNSSTAQNKYRSCVFEVELRLSSPVLEVVLDFEVELRLSSPVLEVVLDDDVGDGVEYELDVVGVRRAGEVSVDLFRLTALVKVLELFLDVGRRLVVCVHA